MGYTLKSKNLLLKEQILTYESVSHLKEQVLTFMSVSHLGRTLSLQDLTHIEKSDRKVC